MPSTKDRLKALFTSTDAYATTLVTVFLDKYGTEGLGWAPATIRLQMLEDFGVELTSIGFDRLMAAIAVLTTDYFYKNLSRFNDLCNVLSGNDFDPTQTVPADVVECAWGITEAAMLAPPDFNEDKEPFCDEIRRYVGEVLVNEGFQQPPGILRIAIMPTQADADWSDDPAMFQSISEMQAQKTAAVAESLSENLKDLATQLESLPLQNGRTIEIVARIRAAIGQSEERQELKPV